MSRDGASSTAARRSGQVRLVAVPLLVAVAALIALGILGVVAVLVALALAAPWIGARVARFAAECLDLATRVAP